MRLHITVLLSSTTAKRLFLLFLLFSQQVAERPQTWPLSPSRLVAGQHGGAGSTARAGGVEANWGSGAGAIIAAEVSSKSIEEKDHDASQKRTLRLTIGEGGRDRKTAWF